MLLTAIGLMLSIYFEKVIAVNDSDILNQHPVVTNLSIFSFLDSNNYIRLNISWDNVRADDTLVSIRFQTNEECNPINDFERFAIHEVNYVIVPSMELEHPADNLKHGCKYDITVEEENDSKNYQKISYEVPECVENKCTCKDVTNSPYRLESIRNIRDDIYSIKWDKLSDENLTVHEIFYRKINNSLKTYIPEINITNTINGVDIPLPDLKEDMSYRVTVKFVDNFNECTYISSINVKAPQEKQGWVTILIGITFTAVLILIVSYILFLKSPKIKNKLNKYCFKRPYILGTEENMYKPTPVLFTNYRQEISAQYTPLEFTESNHDKYELPRNKIILQEQIDKGAFGQVFKAKAYGLENSIGFTIVAVKQLKEDSLPEEKDDLQNEIDILKKVGIHQNIVRLLGCVTLGEPKQMVLELVEGGSLIKYLHKLRDQWDNRLNTVFFPVNMVETWLEDSDKKSSDGSYIQPDDVFGNSPPSPISNERYEKLLRLKIPENYQESENSSPQCHPLTPISLTSSRLPSCTDTEITTVDLEPGTPFIVNGKKSPEPILDHTELQKFALQIARGMAYLENLNIAHRDLAARNILITHDKMLKITDFGLSRNGPYVSSKHTKLPLRWMAIEAIEERTCDSKSDVWSFGIVLWEIGTLGGFPYETTKDNLLLFNLKRGRRLDRPELCTDEMYNLMLQCWTENPCDRPAFSELLEFLDTNKKKTYVNISEINPKYVFPPTNYSENV